MVLSLIFAFATSNLVAQNFSEEYKNQTLYYKIVSDTSVYVTKGDIGGYRGNIIIPDSVTHDSTKYYVVGIDDYAFALCDSLTEIMIPHSVIKIGKFAFQTCPKLTSIDLSDSILTIDKAAFKQCYGLKTIKLPVQLTSVSIMCFMEDSVLNNIYIGNNITRIDTSAFERCYRLTNITIDNPVKTISKAAFALCEIIPAIVVPNSVTTIEDYAFYNCPQLQNVQLGTTLANASLNFISKYAFGYCTHLIKTTIKVSTPPIIFENTFIGIEAKHVLHVPCSTKVAYDSADYWEDLDSIKEDCGVGLNEITETAIKLYPNPAKNEVIIEYDDMERILITSMLGQEICNYQVNGNRHVINVSTLKKGLYIVRIITRTGRIKIQKLEIQ
jgi:hypothetical protein